MADITGVISYVGAIQGVISSADAVEGVISSAGVAGGLIAGQRGLKGDKGDPGDTGETGNGIASAVLNQDYTLTLTFTDGTSYTTPSIRGAQGDIGETGTGITDVTMNLDYTLTITFSDGTTYTTASIRGEKGDTGETGSAGADGYSPMANVSKTGNVATITITDKTGTTTAQVYDGEGSITDVTQNGTSVLDGTVAKVTVPTKVSDLTNDSGFITGYTETDPTVPAWAKQSTKPSYTASEVGALPDTTSIPSKTSDLTNDSDFVSGDVIADEYSASSTYAVGDYCVYNGQLYRCITAISTAEAWTAAHWTMVTVGEELTDLKGDIPQNVSDLTNDSGFQTGTQVNTAIELALTSYKNVYRVDLPSFSSLPLTFSNSKITADHEIINAVLGTPSAQTSDWTLTPTAGSATLSGSISGSTTLTLYIAEVESLTVT